MSPDIFDSRHLKSGFEVCVLVSLGEAYDILYYILPCYRCVMFTLLLYNWADHRFLGHDRFR